VFPSPSRRSSAHFNEADPQIGFAAPFRRDELARVRIASDSAVVPSSLSVEGRWRDQGGISSLPFVPMGMQLVACPADAGCAGQRFCACGDIGLSAPRFESLNGTFELQLKGKTAASTVATV